MVNGPIFGLTFALLNAGATSQCDCSARSGGCFSARCAATLEEWPELPEMDHRLRRFGRWIYDIDTICMFNLDK